MPDSTNLTRLSLSIIMPALNEQDCILETLQQIAGKLEGENIRYEIVVVDDGSTDRTAAVVQGFARRTTAVRLHKNAGPRGFGMAVRAGLEVACGDCIAIMMADGSDSSQDLLSYYRAMEEGYDCVFGSRFIKGGKTTDYPWHKLVLNRLANLFIRVLFGFRYDDITNAFKCYSREAVDAMQPLIAPHFNLTVEMPLKAIVRGFSYKVIPISWTNRKAGVSRLRIKEMGSRYLFIVLYLWLEKYLSRGDYHRASRSAKRAEGESIAASRV